jgi:SAM-dependent methyltransferase
VEEVACNLCGSDNWRLWQTVPVKRFGPDGAFNLVRCQDCGLVYVNPRPSPEEMNEYYPAAYYENLASIGMNMRRWYQGNKLRRLQAHRQGGRLLDIGCNDGLFLYLAREAGWQVQGVEVAGPGVTYAREVLKVDVFVGELTEANFPEQYFDVVTFWHVLEHLYDPLRELRETHSILKPDGLLVIEVPNIASLQARLFSANWAALDIPRHLYHFSPDSLQAMLERAGFTCFKLSYWSEWHNMAGWDQPIVDLVFRLMPKSAEELRSPGAFGKGLPRYVRYAAFLSLHWGASTVERAVTLLGRGGVMDAYARKRRESDKKCNGHERLSVI